MPGRSLIGQTKVASFSGWLGSGRGDRRASGRADPGAARELDVETAHAVCEKCKILLVEANSESDAKSLGTGRGARRRRLNAAEPTRGRTTTGPGRKPR